MKSQLIYVYILFQTVKQTHSELHPLTYIVNQQNSIELRCSLNIETLMNFLYGNQCVQIILDVNKQFPVKCIADLLKTSENITVFTRPFAWLIDRNIYQEEILYETLENMTTRFCENYLIFLKSVQSITSIITTQDPKNTTKNFYPFSKIYFIIENLNYSSNMLKEVSNIFHDRSLFGYIFEFNLLTNTFVGLRDLITLNYTVANDYQKTNLIHPFVDRKNTKKVFRISFHECYPYVLYTDEQNLSWILLSFWIGISYSTIYTSRLTSPGFTKLIDTLEDFLSNGLYWGTFFLYPDIGASLKLSSNPTYHQLHDGIKFFKNRNDAETQLESRKCCVLGGISRNKYLISYDWNKELTLFTSFRLMKKICILNYYSIFPLQKFSPYTELFSEHALRYQEHGFSEYWYSVIYREKRWYETFFEDYPKPDNEPKALEMSSIIGALLILFTNCILAILVFILEVISKISVI